MPTSKPRITSYLDPELYQKLEKFKKDRGLKTLSKAAKIALEDYFAMTENVSAKNRKQTVKEIKELMLQMQNRLFDLQGKIEDLESPKNEE